MLRRHSGVRRGAAAIAILALTLQALLFATHRPAQAAAVNWVLDPAALCMSGDMAADPADHNAPLAKKAAMVCPICQTLTGPAAALQVAELALDVPLAAAQKLRPQTTAGAPAARSDPTARPRGPPALI